MDVITHVIAFFAGLGAGWTLKIIISNTSSKSKKITTQNKNTVGGDIAGGDINKNNR